MSTWRPIIRCGLESKQQGPDQPRLNRRAVDFFHWGRVEPQLVRNRGGDYGLP